MQLLITTNKTVSLALQGGGTYGAFTWGVLDRLLDEEHLVIDSLTGSSAGAINAVVMADGHAFGGGRRGAQAALRRFWTTLGKVSLMSPLQRSPVDRLTGRWVMDYTPAYHLMEMMGAIIGPVANLPVTINPLKQFLATMINFERVRGCEEFELFIGATNVRTGTGKIFTRKELDVQRLIASACLPTVFAGVEIDGEVYWDGSYVANPPLFPLLERPARDVIVVQINPINRSDLPRSQADIANRSNEIAFNIAFVREISSLYHIQHLAEEERAARVAASATRLHLISGLDTLVDSGISSKFNSELPFLESLHAQGVEAAETWLREHGRDLGHRTTLDPARIFAADIVTERRESSACHV
ncbi:patatin-like phospholipase family protein [Pseudoduganella umbonata]|uniref:NTE family protein n=1 Tax=Pseudoduganella umbonata TaxID=864828 RepID=A0A4P8HIT1_9BURK|nr:patatin-like phospholipase family protein [Pseudoduganella umbonata]MBB3219511.1 NTE family protein [Pseudoduganella umbonata]QCP09589.1 patatin-like phospholipase family protein [Pseudoduganella umbonata]